MSSTAWPDLARLAKQWSTDDAEFRAALLRLQVDLFLAAPSRNPAAIAMFETLACGILPLVPSEIARLVGERLAHHPDVPPSVLQALAAHEASRQKRAGCLAGSVLAEAGPPSRWSGHVPAMAAGTGIRQRPLDSASRLSRDPSRPRVRRAESVPPGRRSRATTGRDRS